MPSLLKSVVADIESKTASCLEKKYNHTQKAVFQTPRDTSHGHIATSIAIQCGKKVGKDPLVVAKHIQDEIEAMQYVASVDIVSPGFVNVWLDTSFFKTLLKEVSEEKDFGTEKPLKGKRWRIEYASPNPNKAMHIGHLRNSALGMSLVRLSTYNGAEVVSEMVDNNRGIAIAKVMWGFLQSMKKNTSSPTEVAYWTEHREEWHTPESASLSPDIFITHCYVAGEKACNEEATEKKVRDLVVAWEEKCKEVRALWEVVLSYAYAGQEKTFSRLKATFDVVWHEHEHYKKGKEYVEKGLSSGVFERVEDGAVKTVLESYGITDTILLKRDGTALYITQDIALTALKKEAGGDMLFWVVGVDQSLAMKQMFCVCEQLGIIRLDEVSHISYGYVHIKKDEGIKKMSSREGSVVLLNDVIDSVKKDIYNRFIEDGKDEKSNIEDVSERLARSSALFSVLNIERNQDMVFDIYSTTDTKGASAMYCLYTLARAKSLVKKSKQHSFSLHPDVALENNEVVREVALFAYAVSQAQQDLSPHHLTQYALRLCSAFNKWYGEESILDGSEYEMTKVCIVSSFISTLEKTLYLLNIDSIETL